MAGAVVPVFGIPVIAFYAVEVSVDPGGVSARELIDEVMCTTPVSGFVEPEGLELDSEGVWRFCATECAC